MRGIKHVAFIQVALVALLAIGGCTGEGGGPGPDGAGSSGNGEYDEAVSAAPPEDSPFGFHPAGVTRRGYPDSGFKDAQNIGVGWAREGVYAFWFLIQPDIEKQEYDFSTHDRQWASVPENIRILANIAPQTDRRDEGRLKPGSWLPVDEAKYRAFVRVTVERYDGDGADDMPGLKNPITYWQVGNEPDQSRRRDFAALQRLTYEEIKEACPGCQVLIGGVPGSPRNYIRNFDEHFAPILAELGGCCVDIFDFHWYGNATGDYRLRDTATGEDVVEHILGTLADNGFPSGMPLWITEMGSYSGDPADGRFKDPPQTERQQASDYFKRFIYSLSHGVGKVFPAFGLMEGFKHNDGYFDHTGLIYNGEGPGDPGLGVKKLGYYTYKKTTGTLAGADWSTLETLHDGAGSDHLYLLKVLKDSEPVYIAWWDYFDEPGYKPGDTTTINISDATGAEASVTTVVPPAASGKEVTDYVTAFPTRRVPVNGGTITLQLGEEPVIVKRFSRPP